MIAAGILDRLRAAGVHVVVDLALEAEAEPPADLLAELEAHKGEVLALLTGAPGARAKAGAAHRVPPALVLCDGRRHWRLAGTVKGAQAITDDVRRLRAAMHAAGVELVADSRTLAILAPARWSGAELPLLVAQAGAILTCCIMNPTGGWGWRWPLTRSSKAGERNERNRPLQ